MQSLLFGQSLKKNVNRKLPLKKDMTDIGLITRELPVRESTSVMTSIKMEKSVTEDGTGPRQQPGFSFDMGPGSCEGKNMRDAHGLQEIGGVHDVRCADLGKKLPVDYSLMQERLHGSFKRLTTQTGCVVGF